MLVDTFQKMRGRHNQSIMIISHQERIMALADDIMVVAGGRITQYGPRELVLPGLQASGSCSCELNTRPDCAPLTAAGRM